MITLEKIEHEITQTMEEPMSLHSIEKLNALYKAKRNLNGHEAHRGRLSREEAHEWVRSMEHEDGTKGEHWTCEQTTQVMRNKGYEFEPAEWYAIMNAMHADYFKVAKMFGVDNIDFYAAMAKAWLCDDDAVEDKARQYWEHVAWH